jgi:hypothetical protein
VGVRADGYRALDDDSCAALLTKGIVRSGTAVLVKRAGDGIALDKGSAVGGEDSAAAIRDDDVVLNCGCGVVDEDSAGGLAGGGLGATMLNGEAGDDAGSELMGPEGDDCRSRPAAAVNDGRCGAGGAVDGDGFAEEVDIFVVGAGGDEDGVAVVGRVDAGLDRKLVGWDVNSLLGKRGGDEAQCKYQPESRIKTGGYCVAVLARDAEGVWAWHWTEMHYRSSSEEHGLNVVWSHNNMATITGWPAGHESHFGCILEAAFAHRLIVSHDQVVKQRTRVCLRSLRAVSGAPVACSLSSKSLSGGASDTAT